MGMEPNPAPPPITPPSGGQNNFDFIMNPPKAKKSWFAPGGSSGKQQLLMAVAGGGLLLIVLVLVVSVIFGGKNNADSLLTTAQEQQEIIRVADLGITGAKTAEAKNFAITTKLSVQTSQTLIIERLKNLGTKVKPKTLALKQNLATDQTLATATTNSTFDSVFVKLLQDELAKYRTSIKALYTSIANQTEKQILAASYDGTGILVAQKITL